MGLNENTYKNRFGTIRWRPGRRQIFGRFPGPGRRHRKIKVGVRAPAGPITPFFRAATPTGPGPARARAPAVGAGPAASGPNFARPGPGALRPTLVPLSCPSLKRSDDGLFSEGMVSGITYKH
jgi:hypothetical protein